MGDKAKARPKSWNWVRSDVVWKLTLLQTFPAKGQLSLFCESVIFVCYYYKAVDRKESLPLPPGSTAPPTGGGCAATSSRAIQRPKTRANPAPCSRPSAEQHRRPRLGSKPGERGVAGGGAWRGRGLVGGRHVRMCACIPRKHGTQDSGAFQAWPEDDAPALPGRTSPSC